MIDANKINQLANLIEKAAEISVITHMKPDGDAMGSSLAMYHFLTSFTKCNVRIVLNDRYPANLAFLVDETILPHIIVYGENPEAAVQRISSSDLIICLDFNAFHRTDRLEESLTEASSKKVLIDHHLFPDLEHFTLAFSTQEISSASELLFHILKAMPQCDGKASNLPMKAAEALMTGMTTDTNNFNNSVYPSTFSMASELIAIGVDRDRILFNLFNRFGENRLRLLGTMLKDLLTITEDGVAYMVLDKEIQERYQINEGDTEGFVNMPLSIDKVRMSFLLKEDGDRVRVSIRSKKGTSANRCSRLHFNGGGHENAAGGRLNIPSDIQDIREAGKYVEKHTHIYLTEEHEA
jgi:phosphoesterase RecJ-like protein